MRGMILNYYDMVATSEIRTHDGFYVHLSTVMDM